MSSGLLRYRTYRMRGAFVVTLLALFISPAIAQEKKPNILVIMSDDVGLTNISAYSRGLAGYRTPLSSAPTEQTNPSSPGSARPVCTSTLT